MDDHPCLGARSGPHRIDDLRGLNLPCSLSGHLSGVVRVFSAESTANLLPARTRAFIEFAAVLVSLSWITAPSNLRRAAIDEELDSVDEAAVIGREEDDSLGNLVRRAGAAYRSSSRGLCFELFDLLVVHA